MENLKKAIQEVVNIYKSGNLSKSEYLAKKLIVSNPKVVFLYNLLGLILAGQKKIDEAIKFYKKGIEIDPKFAMIYNNLGLLYSTHKSNGNITTTENFFKKSISLDSKIAEPHNNLGTFYNSLNKIQKAINCFKRAIKINQNLPIPHHNLATAYISIGKFEDAKKHLNKAIKLSPNLMVAHRSLSRITKYTVDNKHFKKLKKIYQIMDHKNLDKRMNLGFALGKAYEDIKNYSKSFLHYKEANSAFRETFNFSIKESKNKFEEIKDIYNLDLYERYKNVGYFDCSPIFIVGMPRSGTTLIEQILSSHSKVFGGDEVDFIPKVIHRNFSNKDQKLFFNQVENFKNTNFKKMGKEYYDETKKISNNMDRFTDKLPSNFLSIGLIKLILPKSKIIHCYRNPKDNCLSIYKNHFTSGRVQFAYDLSEIVEYYNLYFNLMKYWNNLLPNFIFGIKYENLISDTKKQIRKLLNACELDWSDDCLRYYKNQRTIKTASDIQARKKIYNSSVDSWKNYGVHLNKYFKMLVN